MRPIAPKKSRFADEIGERYGELEYVTVVVKLYNDSVVQAVTFACLIY